MVHGEAKSKIKKSISVIADKDLQRMLLKSKIKSYEMYAVKQFAVEDYEANMDHLVEIFKNAAPLDRGWILKKMPKACFSADSFVEQIYQGFSDFDSNTGTLLIRNLGHSTSLAREYLSSQLEEMTKNQLKEFLASLDVMEGVILNNLSDYASNVASVNGYIVKEFLEAR